MSEELLTFHKAIYQMQEQEEELIDCHHQVTEVSTVTALWSGFPHLLESFGFFRKISRTWKVLEFTCGSA